MCSVRVFLQTGNLLEETVRPSWRMVSAIFINVTRNHPKRSDEEFIQGGVDGDVSEGI